MKLRAIRNYPHLVIEPEGLEGPVEFGKLFGRVAPVHLEIGSGKGTFLVSQARAFPQINFVGIEWASKYYRYAVDRFGRWGIDNVRMIRTDAADFIENFVPDGSIEMFHIYFPDPWPKKRHHKRRFFDADNVHQLHRCLLQGGLVNIATDHEDYYRQMKEVAGQVISESLFEEAEFIRPVGAREGETVGTNFERKYLKQGKSVYSLALRKV